MPCPTCHAGAVGYTDDGLEDYACGGRSDGKGECRVERIRDKHTASLVVKRLLTQQPRG